MVVVPSEVKLLNVILGNCGCVELRSESVDWEAETWRRVEAVAVLIRVLHVAV